MADHLEDLKIFLGTRAIKESYTKVLAIQFINLKDCCQINLVKSFSIKQPVTLGRVMCIFLPVITCINKNINIFPQSLVIVLRSPNSYKSSLVLLFGLVFLQY
jgi:hypothetical protein